MIDKQLFVVLALAGGLTACGGNDSGPISVGKEAATFDVSGAASLNRKMLQDAQVTVLAERCYAEDPAQQPPDRVFTGGPPPVLYEYDIPAAQLNAAQAVGFTQTRQARARYLATSMPCVSEPDVAPVQ